MKKSIITMKPNIKRKVLRSEILQRNFKIYISMKARRCIMKAGSFDKYLMTTSVKDIDSKFGLYVRDLMFKKQKDPNLEIGYIPGNSHQGRTKKTSIWEYK
jgi:ribosomal protein L28